MKQYRYFHVILSILVVTLLSACSGDESIESTVIPASDGTYTYKLHLNYQIADSSAETTRASMPLNNGTTIYMRFKDGSYYISGTAVYNSSSGAWTVTTTSSLPSTLSGSSCEAYYFKNPGTVYSTSINLTENTACYQGLGSYSHPNSDNVYVNVTLKPKNWRLRFYGSSGNSVTIQESGSDIYYYSSFNRNTGDFISQKKDLSLYVGTNSFTQYIYGIFQVTKSSNAISISTNNNELFYRSINGLTLRDKGSGYLTIPTANNYSQYGWRKVGASMTNTRFSYSGGNKTLTINAPSDMPWTLSQSGYVTLDKTSGNGDASVTVSMSSNSASYRYSEITFRAGNKYTQTISLVQGYRQRIIDNWTIKYPGATRTVILYGVKAGDILDFDWSVDGQKHQYMIYLTGASYASLVNRNMPYWGYDNYSSHITHTFTTGGDYTLYVNYSSSYDGQYYKGASIRNVYWIHN